MKRKNQRQDNGCYGLDEQDALCPKHITCRRFGRRHGDLCRRDVGDQRRRGAVHEDVADVVEQLLRAVLRGLQIEQLRVLVDEAGVDG